MQSASDFFTEFEESMAKMPEWFQWIFGGTNVWDMILNNGLQVLGVGAIGWVVATLFERQHFKEMDEREKVLGDITLSTTKINKDSVEGVGMLLMGTCVVAHDFFRTIVITFRKLVGGNIKPYERLVHRGRREALIRLKEEAHLRGFNKIINIRFGGSHVSGKFLSAVEMVAYGTAVKVKK